jgi:hypothetical protein
MIKVLPIVIDPIVDNGQPLTQYYGIPDILAWHGDILKDLESVFGEEFTTVEPLIFDSIPVKQDGFMYTTVDYLDAIKDSQKHHEPDLVNYWDFMDKFHLIQRKLNGDFDEVHVLGGPWMGFHESQMVGIAAIPCNSGPIMASCPNFVIMGYNYERGRSEALEDMGHRAEFILADLYPNNMKSFNSGTGTIHKPFNATNDYDWSNKNFALETHHGETRTGNCELWGCNGLGYMKWWFSRLEPYMRHDVIHFDNWKGNANVSTKHAI